MRSHLIARKRRAASAASEGGFTMVEMVIAIPVVFLVLGLVLSSVGITIGLMGQVASSAGAARVANSVMDELNSVRSCPELSRVLSELTASSGNENFAVSFSGYSCSEEMGFPLTVEVREVDSAKLKYSKTLTLAAM